MIGYVKNKRKETPLQKIINLGIALAVPICVLILWELIVKQAVTALYKKAVSGCAEKLMSWIDLGSIVEEKINAMSAEELEALVMSVMKKELNTIVNLGALIGFVLGLINIFI